MRALIQRVSKAEVKTPDDGVIGNIQRGLLVFIGFVPTDTEAILPQMARKLLGLRVFSGRRPMDLSVQDVAGGILLVPQFTLAADLQRGMRPSFSKAAPPELAERLFDAFTEQVRSLHSPFATGKFGATMQVHLINDGPATFWLDLP